MTSTQGSSEKGPLSGDIPMAILPPSLHVPLLGCFQIHRLEIAGKKTPYTKPLTWSERQSQCVFISIGQQRWYVLQTSLLGKAFPASLLGTKFWPMGQSRSDGGHSRPGPENNLPSWLTVASPAENSGTWGVGRFQIPKIMLERELPN